MTVVTWAGGKSISYRPFIVKMADFRASAIEEKRKRKYLSADLCGKQASGSGSGCCGGKMLRYGAYKL